MTLNDSLKEGYSVLFYAETETPSLDATILLAESLGITKERLFASLSDEIDEQSYRSYRKLLDRRCSGYPVSYIIGRKEFYGLEFKVDERVLAPRPDTEALVEAVLEIVNEEKRLNRIIDVCTGSGCVAIALKHTNRSLTVSASDISVEALEVCKINSVRLLGCGLESFISDLLGDIEGTYDIIVSNPPYLTEKEVTDMKKIGWPEPSLALLGGTDGTAITDRLINEAKGKLSKGGWIVIESAPHHMEKLRADLSSAGYENIRIWRDLGARERVIAGKMC
jgi:release factor glutamine methyltransferase